MTLAAPRSRADGGARRVLGLLDVDPVTGPSLSTLRAIVDGTASVVGGDFFQELVRHLVRCVDVPIAFVCEIADPDRSRARTCALFCNGEFQPNFEYDLAGTPCEGVVARQVCFHSDDVSRKFPEDKWLAEIGARAYLGVPFFDSKGDASGHIGVIDTRARDDGERLRMLLEVFANRAAAELERMQVDVALASSHTRLQQLNAELELRVVERTAELEEALRRSREALQLRDDFIRAASHELSTPLTSVHLSAQRLVSRADRLSPEDRADVERLGRQVERLRSLVGQMLDGVRLQVAEPSLRRGPVDLVHVVERVLQTLEPDRARSSSTVALLRTEPVVGSWDESRVEQVVTHLVGNAIKYGRGEPIEVEVTSSPEHARLRVTDQGIGLPAAERERIFEPFHRAAPLPSYGGLGLGLYICRRIAHAHGGTVSVHSVEDEGSTFVLELPRGHTR